MSTIGDIISELSTTTPLAHHNTFTSQPYAMQEYNSISVIYFSDQANRITISWSADAVNWDLVKSYSLSANTPDQISMITYSKWCKITVNNFTDDSETILRLEVYGTVSNNAVSSNIQGNTANVLPEFSVVNSFDYNAFQSQHIESWSPQFTYNFAGLTGGYTGSTGTTSFNAGYSNLAISFSDTGGTPAFQQNLYWFDGSSMMLSQQAGQTYCQTMVKDSKFLKMFSGVGNRFIFTAAITRDQSRTYISGGTGQPNLWVGAGYATNFNVNDGVTNPIVDGLFFGYNGGTGNYLNYDHAFGIFYVNNRNITFYPQYAWNVDRCDGGGPIPPMPVINGDGWANANTYAFSFALNGNILCYIQNPISNKFTLVHYISYGNSSGTNLTQNFYNQRFGPIVYSQNLLAASAVDNFRGYIRLFNYHSGYEQSNPIIPTNQYYISNQFYYTSAVKGTKYGMLEIDNQTTITNSAGTINNTSTTVKASLLAVNNNSSTPTTLEIWVNQSFGGTGVDGPYYVDQGYSPISYIQAQPNDPNSNTPLVPVGPNGKSIFNITIPQYSIEVIDLTPFNALIYPGGKLSFYSVCVNGSSLNINISTNILLQEYH
jgi:hypothetical protein